MSTEDQNKPFNIAEHVGRYSLTYEQWLEHALYDPEGYGMTKAQVQACIDIYNAGKAHMAATLTEHSVTDSVKYSNTTIHFVEQNNQPGNTDGTSS